MDDDDDLGGEDVDAMFESLLNNTFDDHDRVSSSRGEKRTLRQLGIGPNANTQHQREISMSSVDAGSTAGTRKRLSGSPSPTASEYDTPCDPWEDY